MSTYLTNIIVDKIIGTDVKGGKSVLEIYNSGEYTVKNKKDNSPLTFCFY